MTTTVPALGNGGLQINFDINPSDITSASGIEILIVSFVVFLLFGFILKHGIAITMAIVVLSIVLYFVSGVAPAFTTFGGALWTTLSTYIPSIITLATGLMPLSIVTSAAGFALGFLSFGSDSPVSV